MTPEYLNELADAADPGQLWRLGALEQLALPPQLRRQLDTGVALRRQAHHIATLRSLLDTGRSLLLTPLSPNGTDVRTVPTPAELQRDPGAIEYVAERLAADNGVRWGDLGRGERDVWREAARKARAKIPPTPGSSAAST